MTNVFWNMDKIKNPYIHLHDEGYNCFACAPWNPVGLHMEFFEDGDDIVSFWEPGINYQSWLNTLHGGIQATLLDETAGWYVTRKMQTAGVTSAMSVRYRHNVPAGPGVKLEIRVKLKEVKHNLVFLQGSISHEGQVCTTAELTYFTFPQDRARKDFFFSGCELEKDADQA